jgi:hypothetical protein
LSQGINGSAAGLLELVGGLTGLELLHIGAGPKFSVGDADLMLLSRLTKLHSLGPHAASLH